MSHFAIKSIINKGTCKEIGWRLISRSEKIYFAIVLFCGLMAAIFFAIGEQYLFTFGAILFVVLLPIFYFRNLKQAAKLYFKRVFESTGANELELEISFNDDKVTIFCVATKGTSFIEYENIARLEETKNMYVVFTKAKQFIAISKNELVGKSERKKFIKFITSKMEK